MSLPPGEKLAPRGELWSIGEMFKTSFTPDVNTHYCLEKTEGRTEGMFKTSFTPGVNTLYCIEINSLANKGSSPWRDNVHPWGANFTSGDTFRP
jgi:hypothetical protein